MPTCCATDPARRDDSGPTGFSRFRELRLTVLLVVLVVVGVVTATGPPTLDELRGQAGLDGMPVGRGPRGGWQTTVRVHIDKNGMLHAHPKGDEY